MYTVIIVYFFENYVSFYILSCLFDISNKICSNDTRNIIEMDAIRHIFIKNNYPEHLIDQKFEKF